MTVTLSEVKLERMKPGPKRRRWRCWLLGCKPMGWTYKRCCRCWREIG